MWINHLFSDIDKRKNLLMSNRELKRELFEMHSPYLIYFPFNFPMALQEKNKKAFMRLQIN